ncbi:MAG: GAF domain-containing protein [Flavobacteriaceae bacterium]|nr:GAF domain-containing protein [Flavobacteriaceae bacterium]
MSFESLKSNVIEILSNDNESVENRLHQVCELLQKSIDHYDWVGFYFRNGEREELKLGPYVGDPTDHVIIPFGKGICGQVALSNENFVVPDVSAQDNYIACSIHVKAEIVVPIFVNAENVGQIDIDSQTPDPFTESDEHFLEFICQEVSHLL